MTVRTDIESALESWASDGSEGLALAEHMFTDITAAIRRRFPDTTLGEAELLLADIRRDAESDLFALTCNTIDRDAAVDIVVQRFFGED